MLNALTIQQLNEDVVYHFLETLFSEVAEQYQICILQDRQSAPRPTDTKGFLKNYLYFRTETPRTVQQMTQELVDEEGKTYQRTISQKQLVITANFIGKDAGTLATYFDHAINSELAYSALRPVVDGRVVEFQYRNHSDPVDLTEIEQTKFLARYQYEIRLGFVDVQDFPIDVFDTMEVKETIQAADSIVSVSSIIIKGE